MEFTRNIDKYCEPLTGLYNSVLSISFSGEGGEPVTLAEAKYWGKIEQDSDDDIITALITAARRMCEQFSGIGFITRTIEAGINNSNGGFALPYGPITAGPSAVDTDGNTLDLIYNLGQIESPSGRMVVTYTAGHSSLPEELKTALKAQFLFLYQNRGEGAKGLSPIAEMILAPLRVVV